VTEKLSLLAVYQLEHAFHALCSYDDEMTRVFIWFHSLCSIHLELKVFIAVILTGLTVIAAEMF
jgi:hypothetical protein